MSISSRKFRKRHRGQKQLRTSEQLPTSDAIPQSRPESETNSEDDCNFGTEKIVMELQKNEDSKDETNLLPQSLQSFYSKITGSREAIKKPDSISPSQQSTVYNVLSTLIDTINDWDHSRKIVINPEQSNPPHASLSLLDQLAEEVKKRLKFAEEENLNVSSPPQSHQEEETRGDSQSSSNKNTMTKKKSISSPAEIPSSNVPHKEKPRAHSHATKWKSKIYWSAFFTERSILDQGSFRYIWNEIDVGCTQEEALREFFSTYDKVPLILLQPRIKDQVKKLGLKEDGAKALPDHSDDKKDKSAESLGHTSDNNNGKQCEKYTFTELQDALVKTHETASGSQAVSICETNKQLSSMTTASGTDDNPQISSPTLSTFKKGNKRQEGSMYDNNFSRYSWNNVIPKTQLASPSPSELSSDIKENDAGSQISLILDFIEKENETTNACQGKSSLDQNDNGGRCTSQYDSKKETIENDENEKKEVQLASTSPSELSSNIEETDTGSQISLTLDIIEEEDETINVCENKSSPDQNDNEGFCALRSGIQNGENEKKKALSSSTGPSELSSNIGETDTGSQISLRLDVIEEEDETFNACQDKTSPDQNDVKESLTLQSCSKKDAIENDENHKEEGIPTSTCSSELSSNIGESATCIPQETRSPPKDKPSLSNSARGEQGEMSKMFRDDFPFAVPWPTTNQDESKRPEGPMKVEEHQNIGQVSVAPSRAATNRENSMYTNSFYRSSWMEINLSDSTSSSSSSTISEEFQEFVQRMYGVDEDFASKMNEDRKQKNNGGQFSPFYLLNANYEKSTQQSRNEKSSKEKKQCKRFQKKDLQRKPR